MPQEELPIDVDSHALPSKNPMALTLGDAAMLLTKMAGVPITVAMLETDLAAGAPRNADGTLNLVHYAAWLVQVAGRREAA